MAWQVLPAVIHAVQLAGVVGSAHAAELPPELDELELEPEDEVEEPELDELEFDPDELVELDEPELLELEPVELDEVDPPELELLEVDDTTLEVDETDELELL